MEIQKGDLLIAGSGETSTEIGKTVTYLDDQKAFAGGDIIILRPNQKVDSLFISYALNTEQKIKERAELGQGHSVVHIYSSTLSNMKVILPELSEQREIAKRLKTIEETIDLISNKVLELKQQKKGLMQLLLTGQVRTKV